MVTRREESDGRVVPQGERKPVPTEPRARGGKATTASKKASQLQLDFETAANPQGATTAKTSDHAAVEAATVPKSESTTGTGVPAMVMEEVASEDNLRNAFESVRRNKGAAGPDRMEIKEVRKRLGKILPVVRRELLAGRYLPGNIRRVWIPKPGGGERGLGIPNVVDRVVQQAVHQVLGPNYEPTFHDGSHGFRPGRSCHTAIGAAARHVYCGRGWVVDLDLEKFFGAPGKARRFQRVKFPPRQGREPLHRESSLGLLEVTT